VLVGVSFVVFLALHLTPGDSARILLGPLATPAELIALRAQRGLDQSVLV
jgi:peptide/nickel transport system permease protein